MAGHPEPAQHAGRIVWRGEAVILFLLQSPRKQRCNHASYRIGELLFNFLFCVRFFYFYSQEVTAAAVTVPRVKESAVIMPPKVGDSFSVRLGAMTAFSLQK